MAGQVRNPVGGRQNKKGATPSQRKNSTKALAGGRDRNEIGPAKAAAIYVPAVYGALEGSTRDLARRIAVTLDSDDAQARKVFKVHDADTDLRYGRGEEKPRAPYYHVVESSEPDQSVLDVYEFSHLESMFDRPDRFPAPIKILKLLIVIGLNFGRLMGSLVTVRDSRGRRRFFLVTGVSCAFALAVFLTLFVSHSQGGGWRWTLPATIVSFGITASLNHLSSMDTEAKTRVVSWIATILGLGSLLIVEYFHTWRWLEFVSEVMLIVGALGLIGATLKLANPDIANRIQLVLGFFAMGLLCVYAVLVLAGVWAAVADEVGDETRSNNVAQELDGSGARIDEIALALAALGITVTPKRLRRAINDSASRLQGAMAYLSMGEGRDPQVGRLYELVEYLAEQGYERMSLIGYSFGAVTTLDAMFPIGTVPPRRIRKIDTIVTVGLPAKSISTFWPEYWKDRHVDEELAKVKWINIYSPFDVLSCEFGNNDEDRAAAENRGETQSWELTASKSSTGLPASPRDRPFNAGPSTRGLAAWRILLLAGLRAHANYWDRDFKNDRGAVALFARQLVSDEPEP